MWDNFQTGPICGALLRGSCHVTHFAYWCVADAAVLCCFRCVCVHRYARMRASDAKYHSPFSYAAIQAGYVYLGGKMDDITVVVSFVGLPAAASKL